MKSKFIPRPNQNDSYQSNNYQGNFIITHVEISLRVIIMAIPEAEAMAKAEAIIVAMVMVGPITGAMPTINSTRQINMVHHVHYAVAIITLPNIASRESMTSMILWKR